MKLSIVKFLTELNPQMVNPPPQGGPPGMSEPRPAVAPGLEAAKSIQVAMNMLKPLQDQTRAELSRAQMDQSSDPEAMKAIHQRALRLEKALEVLTNATRRLQAK